MVVWAAPVAALALVAPAVRPVTLHSPLVSAHFVPAASVAPRARGVLPTSVEPANAVAHPPARTSALRMVVGQGAFERRSLPARTSAPRMVAAQGAAFERRPLVPIKYLVLMLLVVQNSATTLLVKFTRTPVPGSDLHEDCWDQWQY